MALVSFKKNSICAYVLGQTSAFSGHFWTNWAEIFMRVQKTIIYRLLLINPSCNAYVSFLNFWVTFGWKMGVAIVRPQMIGIGGFQTRLKSWPTGSNVWANKYLKIIFPKFSELNPPPLFVQVR